MWGFADLAADLADREPEGIEVWPENMAVTDAWLMVCSQWNTESLATGAVLWHGLRYEGVKASLDLGGVILTPVQWAGVRLMERVAASVLNGHKG